MKTDEYFRKKGILLAAYAAMLVIVCIVCKLVAPEAPLTNEVAATTMTVTTCTTSTTTVTTTTTTVTTVTTTTTEATTTTTVTYDIKDRLVDYGFFRGTYYHGEGANPCPGGSGRMLIDCTPSDNDIKGSVACRRIQEDYGYDINGRTRVYLEFTSYPQMNGWYYVDDACASYNVVDVYFINYGTCPWQNDGTTDIHLWVEPS